MYSPHDLVILVAVAETGSVRAAASAVGRTQPAVTQSIRRLELAVGFALLDRTGYRARLTERGEMFVKRARSAVQQAEGLQQFAASLARGVEPRVRICCHGAIAVDAWIDLTRDVARTFPDTVLELEVAEGDAPARRLLADEAQLALLLHGFPDRYGLKVEGTNLGEVEFVTVVRADRWEQLKAGAPALPQILVADYEDPVTAYGVVDGQPYWRVSDHRMKSAVIVRGDGWGSVPQPLVADELQRGTLRAVSHLGLHARSKISFAAYRRRAAVHGPVASAIWAAAQAWPRRPT